MELVSWCPLSDALPNSISLLKQMKAKSSIKLVRETVKATGFSALIYAINGESKAAKV